MGPLAREKSRYLRFQRLDVLWYQGFSIKARDAEEIQGIG